MRVAFRTDASLQIGTGHVMRCLTLADALRDKGANCQFVCRTHEGHLIDYVQSCGYEAHALPKLNFSSSFESGLQHAHWLGVNWQTDAEQTKEALGIEKLDLLVVDHYALDYRWELEMQSMCSRVMVIDDLADRRHDCHLLLNQNYGSSASRYVSLVPDKCTQLHGPEFALLKPIYAQRRCERERCNGRIERVLVYFGGGADPMFLTEMALHAFQTLELLKIELDVVVGFGYTKRKELKAHAESRGGIHIHSQLPDLSELMVEADLALGAGGATTWERCCLGLPSIVICTADNQLPASEALVADGLISYMGHVGDITPEILRDQVLELLDKPEKLGELSEKSMKLVDGKGVNRILNKVLVR